MEKGRTFSSLEEFEQAVCEFGADNHTVFVKGDSKKAKYPGENDNIVYEYITFVCKRGGKFRPSTSKGIRINQSSLKCGCPVRLRATANRNGTLTLTIVNLDHNHEVSEHLYKSFPEMRRAAVDDSLLSLMACPSVTNRHIRQVIQAQQDIALLPGDVRNLKRRLKSAQSDSDRVEKMMEVIQVEGGSVEYNVSPDGTFQHLVYSTAKMKQTLNRYPDVLVLDSTYSTINTNMLSLTTALAIDSSGNGQPIMHAFIKQKDQVLLGKCLHFLNGLYPLEHPSTIFVDKDFTEFSPLREIFPNAAIRLCAFHVRKAVKQHFQGTNVSQTLLEHYLQLLNQQCTAQTREEYCVQKRKIIEFAPPLIIDYLERHWWSCPDMWAASENLDVPQLHLITTSQLDSYLSKITRELHNNSKLSLSDAVAMLNTNDEQICRCSVFQNIIQKAQTRYNTRIYDEVIVDIMNDLTPFAGKMVTDQYLLSSKIQYVYNHPKEDVYVLSSSADLHHNSSTDECSCKFFVNLKLPCRHIFFVRRLLDKPMYISVSAEHRFSKLQDCEYESQSSVSGQLHVQLLEPGSLKTLNAEEKYVTAQNVLQEIGSYLATVDTNKFYRKLDLISSLLSFWKEDKEIYLMESSLIEPFGWHRERSEAVRGAGETSGVGW